jgi:hypothetical protein
MNTSAETATETTELKTLLFDPIIVNERITTRMCTEDEFACFVLPGIHNVEIGEGVVSDKILAVDIWVDAVLHTSLGGIDVFMPYDYTSTQTETLMAEARELYPELTDDDSLVTVVFYSRIVSEKAEEEEEPIDDDDGHSHHHDHADDHNHGHDHNHTH